MMEINEIRNLFQQSVGMSKQVEKELLDKNNSLEDLKIRSKNLEEGQAFLQKVASDTQNELKFQIEDIVNLALDTCFPDEYIFQLQFNVARGKTEAELVFLSKRTGRAIDPMNASGGGVVDLTAFALRVAVYALERNIDNVIVLDEPFRFLSRDLQARAGEILKKLSKKMGIQIIMVTHISDMIDVADKVFEVKKNAEGISKVRVRG